tara:strand:+ start:976 stop:1194 length:219 start_codon:yes stop_codon:yes gene_type:complete
MTLVHTEILKKEIEWLEENPHTIHRHQRKTVISYLNQRILDLEQEKRDVALAKETLRAHKKASKKDIIEKSD